MKRRRTLRWEQAPPYKERVAKAVEMVAAGAPRLHACVTHSIWPCTLRRRLKKLGVPAAKRGRPPCHNNEGSR